MWAGQPRKGEGGPFLWCGQWQTCVPQGSRTEPQKIQGLRGKQGGGPRSSVAQGSSLAGNPPGNKKLQGWQS